MKFKNHHSVKRITMIRSSRKKLMLYRHFWLVLLFNKVLNSSWSHFAEVGHNWSKVGKLNMEIEDLHDIYHWKLFWYSKHFPGFLFSYGNLTQIRLHRCWWQILETKCVDDNYKIVTVFGNFAITFLHNRRAPTFKICHQYEKIESSNGEITTEKTCVTSTKFTNNCNGLKSSIRCSKMETRHKSLFKPLKFFFTLLNLFTVKS